MKRGGLARAMFFTVSMASALAAGGSWIACVGNDPVLATTSDLCPTYCDTIQKNCRDNQQYVDSDQCMAACALMKQGTSGVVDDTVACRLDQAKAASSKEACANAGPLGNGVCGRDRCAVFCGLVDKHCDHDPAVASPPYNDVGSCIEVCSTRFVFDPNVGTGKEADTKDTLNCREYHLLLSLAPDAAVFHCPHAAVESVKCTLPLDGGAGDASGAGAGH